jgi:quinol monooxygenase YgiN
MSNPAVSIHPYFKVHEGAMGAFKELLPHFIERTATEEGCLQYEFTIDRDTVFCREAYKDAAAALHHVQNVGTLLDKAFEISDLERLEVHGPMAELEKLEEPFRDMNPLWFHYEAGVER